MKRPDKSEYFEYYGAYVDQVPDTDVIDFLREQPGEMHDLLRGLPKEKENFRYAEGKWTLKEVLGHIIDTERVFSYRALSFARGDKSPIPGIEQDDWVAGANFADRDLAHLVDEFQHIRQANVRLFGSFDEEILSRSGEASTCRFTVRAILFIVAGHAAHHMKVLRERYL
jgi:hypothetical protein